MYRYYKTSIKNIDGITLPSPEPDNWLGYKKEDKYYLKSTTNINSQELDDEEVRDCNVDSELLKDQFV